MRACLLFTLLLLASCDGDPAPGDRDAAAPDAAALDAAARDAAARDAAALDAAARDAGPPIALGEEHTGQFHLGPVDWAESEWTNACGPYPSEVQSAEGVLLAGVSNEVAPRGSLCDACVEVTTDMGRTAVLRVVTYGVSGSAGDLDVSPEAYALLDQGEFPRAMSWRLVTCDSPEIMLQFQTSASQWWTSLWVRVPSMAIARVEVQSTNHADWFELSLGTDGTYTDGGGFGEGAYTLRITGVSGASFSYEGAGVTGGELVRTGGNIPL